MTEILTEYGLFLARALTVVVAILVCVGASVAMIVRAQQRQHRDHLEVSNLNQHYDELAFNVGIAMQSPKARKKAARARRRQLKRDSASGTHRARLFVLDFHGDIQASGVSALREEVTAILNVSQEGDEVLLRLESPGGVVFSYGLAASQLVRLKQAGLRLTVAVDKIAASGGYMMACVADHLLAAPFAMLGSIGVVAQLPNFHRWLDSKQVDYELFTAGEHKRTVTVFGENTPEGREKFQQQLDEMHALFKAFVATHRPQLALSEVATGEFWLGTRALELGLVDELLTSDDYLFDARTRADIYALKYHPPREGLRERFHLAARALLSRWL